MTVTKGRVGRPPKAAADKPIRVPTLLAPDLHAAWKADGRPINAILRSVLLP